MKVVLTHQQEIRGLSADQKTRLRDALTFENPAYKSAVRYGRSRYISIPKTLTYFEEYSEHTSDGERRKVITVPSGVNLTPVIGDAPVECEDMRVDAPVKYPHFALKLRGTQKEAERAYLREQENDYPRCLVQMPTGKGKSILALHIAATLGQKTLILVHKDDLVVGWQKDIQLCFPNMKTGLIKAKSRTVGEHITIATVQTLNRMSEEELAQYTQQFGLVVQDECHHIGLNIFNVIGKFNSLYKLGLTATPKRSDGLTSVFDVFLGGICYFYQATEYDEDISSVEVHVLDSTAAYKPFVFDGQVFNACDFDPKDLPDKFEYVSEMEYEKRPKIPYATIDNIAVTAEDTIKVVCDTVVDEYMQGHSILVLFTHKDHIRLYFDRLKDLIPEDTVLLYYGDNKTETAKLLKAAEDKTALVTLATYAKATEGTNVKSWEVEFLVSSRNNEKDIEQATGRVRRRKEGKINPVIVYDVRYRNIYSLKSHYDTHKRVYKALNYTVIDTAPQTKVKRGMFSRGYR